MNKRQVESWKKKIEKHMVAVAKQRDSIDETISELEELREVCRRSYDHMIDARDALSELV